MTKFNNKEDVVAEKQKQRRIKEIRKSMRRADLTPDNLYINPRAHVPSSPITTDLLEKVDKNKCTKASIITEAEEILSCLLPADSVSIKAPQQVVKLSRAEKLAAKRIKRQQKRQKAALKRSRNIQLFHHPITSNAEKPAKDKMAKPARCNDYKGKVKRSYQPASMIKRVGKRSTTIYRLPLPLQLPKRFLITQQKATRSQNNLPETAPIQFFVMGPDGIPIYIRPSSTKTKIKDVKINLEKIYAIPAAKICLFHKSKTLNNSKTLLQYGIRPDDVVYAKTKLAGGGWTIPKLGRGAGTSKQRDKVMKVLEHYKKCNKCDPDTCFMLDAHLFELKSEEILEMIKDKSVKDSLKNHLINEAIRREKELERSYKEAVESNQLQAQGSSKLQYDSDRTNDETTTYASVSEAEHSDGTSQTAQKEPVYENTICRDFSELSLVDESDYEIVTNKSIAPLFLMTDQDSPIKDGPVTKKQRTVEKNSNISNNSFSPFLNESNMTSSTSINDNSFWPFLNDSNMETSTTDSPSQNDKNFTSPKENIKRQNGNSSASNISTLPQPVALSNTSGIQCFLNAIIQILFTIPEFVETLSNWTPNSHNMASELKKLMQRFYNANKDALLSTGQILPFLPVPDSQRHIQQDLEEHMRVIIDEVSVLIGENGNEQPYKEQFNQGTLRTTVLCIHCEKESPTDEKFHILPVAIERTNSLEQALINELAASELMTGANSYTCIACGPVNARKYHNLFSSPKILMMNLKRFDANLQKIHNRMTIPNFLDLNNLTTYPDETNATHLRLPNTNSDGWIDLPLTDTSVKNLLKSGNKIYELIAVANHVGTTIASGHYIAFVKRTNQWYSCNDTKIDAVTAEFVKQQSTRNAYFLVYRQVERAEHLIESPQRNPNITIPNSTDYSTPQRRPSKKLAINKNKNDFPTSYSENIPLIECRKCFNAFTPDEILGHEIQCRVLIDSQKRSNARPNKTNTDNTPKRQKNQSLQDVITLSDDSDSHTKLLPDKSDEINTSDNTKVIPISPTSIVRIDGHKPSIKDNNDHITSSHSNKTQEDALSDEEKYFSEADESFAEEEFYEELLDENTDDHLHVVKRHKNTEEDAEIFQKIFNPNKEVDEMNNLTLTQNYVLTENDLFQLMEDCDTPDDKPSNSYFLQ